jgi:REP-associated tyrosine transposase
MNLTPYTSLSWAYQLHYYLCFRTHRRKQLFSSGAADLRQLIEEICSRHDYHFLECRGYPGQLRCLLSLRPSQVIARVVQTIKTNSSREWSRKFDVPSPVWARGHLAKSAGRMRIDAVRNYLEKQSEHHGYESRIMPPVYHYQTESPVELKASHACFDLSHHVVLSTTQRRGAFTSGIGRALANIG